MFALLTSALSDAGEFHLGRTLTAAEVRRLTRDVGAQGQPLPEGSGNASQGSGIFAARCATCHAHGSGLQSVAQRYPYATTLFDFIRRAMPPDRERTLSASDVYSLTAFILTAEHVLAPGSELNRTSLPDVRMPAKADFVRDDGGPMP